MSGNPRRREVRALTLGFSLGANAAPLDVSRQQPKQASALWALRVSGRNPGDPWPQPNAEGDGLERIRARAEALSIRISSISGYYMSRRRACRTCSPTSKLHAASGAADLAGMLRA